MRSITKWESEVVRIFAKSCGSRSGTSEKIDFFLRLENKKDDTGLAGPLVMPEVQLFDINVNFSMCLFVHFLMNPCPFGPTETV